MRRPVARMGGEDGIAIVTVLLLMVVFAGLIVAITVAAHNAANRAQARSQRVEGLPAADSALNQYRYALETGLVDDSSMFLVGGVAMEQLRKAQELRGVQAQVLTTDQVAAQFPGQRLEEFGTVDGTTPIPVADRLTMQETSGGQVGYWQLYSLHTPDFGSGQDSHVVVYIRAWSAGAGGTIATRPRFVRAELRPGRMSDYQLIADGPIAFGDNATINGPIHSNGFDDSFLGPVPGTRRIFIDQNSQQVSCTGKAAFSTAAGTIDVSRGKGCASTPKVESPDKTINMLRVEDAFKLIERHCLLNLPSTRCYDGDGVVQLGDASIVVNGQRIAVSRATTVLFRGNVKVSGVLRNARVTVAARNPGAQFGAASIMLGSGNVGTLPSATASDALGLLAEGFVVLPIGAPNCTSYVGAAIVAGSGGVTIPAEYRVPYEPPTLPKCAAVAIRGSIAGHYAPMLRLEYNTPQSSKYVGYADRRYTHDDTLEHDPPPYFPLSGPWQVVDFRDANVACLAPDRVADPACK